MSETSDTRAELRLHPDPPRVTRLSRKVLVALGAVTSIVVMGALIWALDGRRGTGDTGRELYNTEHKATPDGLATLPRDYTAVPKLGPPLPGDLGRPILRAQERGQPVPPTGPAITPAMTAEEQRRMQEAEAARLSKLFAATNPRPVLPAALTRPTSPSTAPTVTSAPLPPLDMDAAQNMQERKIAFLNAPVDRRIVSPDRLATPPSPYVVQAGTVIPAALITGIRSDLPGLVTAQVTEHVYDTPTGRHLLIPQGTRLIGQYDSQVAFGQSRVLLVWNRLIMPDGTSIVLERQPGADAAGYSGLEDEVDHHWGRLFKAALLSTLLGVGAELSSNDRESDLVRALRRGSQDTINQTGQQLVRRQLNVQPTLTVRPGFPVRVVVNRDLVLAVYGGDRRDGS